MKCRRQSKTYVIQISSLCTTAYQQFDFRPNFPFKEGMDNKAVQFLLTCFVLVYVAQVVIFCTLNKNQCVSRKSELLLHAAGSTHTAWTESTNLKSRSYKIPSAKPLHKVHTKNNPSAQAPKYGRFAHLLKRT